MEKGKGREGGEGIIIRGRYVEGGKVNLNILVGGTTYTLRNLN